MKKLILIVIVGLFLYSCSSSYKCNKAEYKQYQKENKKFKNDF